MSEIFDLEKLQNFIDTLTSNKELSFKVDSGAPLRYDFPDFGANKLQPTALKHLCLELSRYLKRAVSPTLEIPSTILLVRMGLVWHRVHEACGAEGYTRTNIQRVISALQKEEQISTDGVSAIKAAKNVSEASSAKLSSNEMLIEVGVKTGLSVVFSLLRQAWAQLAWQKQLELTLRQSGAAVPFPTSPGGAPVISLPNEVLKSVLDIMKGLPPLSLSNQRALSSLSSTCLTQSREFLDWIIRPDSFVDSDGKRLALEIMLGLTLQYGDLVSVLEWVAKMLEVLKVYQAEGEKEGDGERRGVMTTLCLSREFCEWTLAEVRRRTVSQIILYGIPLTRYMYMLLLLQQTCIHMAVFV